MQIRNLTFFFGLVSMTSLWVTERLSQTPEWKARLILKTTGEVAIIMGISFALAWFFIRVLKVKIGEKSMVN